MRGRIVRLALKIASLGRSVVMFCLPLRIRGVKAVVRDRDGRVLLVRHTYGSGRWMFPGGRVHRGESFEEAAAREMHEELRIDPVAWELLAEYRSRHGLSRQRLALVGAEADPASIVTNEEIAAVGFFGPGAPPEDTSPATRRRLAELESGGLAGGEW